MPDVWEMLHEPIKPYQLMANALAGGIICDTATAITGAWGGFGHSGTTKGSIRATWSADYTGTPLVVAVPQGPTAAGAANWVGCVLTGQGASSVGFHCFNSANAPTNCTVNVLIFGSATGSRIS